MSDILRSYIAGLFDGEGTITLSYKHKNDLFRAPVSSMSSTTFELLDLLKSSYRGTISKQKIYKEHHKQSWTWRLENDKCLKFINEILPFMHEPKKIRRAKFLLDNYKNVTRRNGRYKLEEVKAKKQFEEEFFKL